MAKNNEFKEAAVAAGAELASDPEFIKLIPKKGGAFDKFKKEKERRSNTHGATDDLPPWSSDWSMSDLRGIVGKAKKAILKKGNFEAASLEGNDRQIVMSFVNDIITRNEIPNNTDVARDIVKTILRIGKSFYEYNDKAEFIDNKTYDGLMSVYLKYADEPTPYIPRSGKVEVKDADYANLAINMNKSYRIHKDDKLPEGVKEEDSIEAWLRRCFKDMGKDPTDEVSIMVTPKLDGIALRGEVRDNVLFNPLTRGDESKSILAKGLDHLELRGESLQDKPYGLQLEVFVKNDDVDKVSAYLGREEPFVSPRHAASGIVNRMCTSPDKELIKYLSFYPIATEGLGDNYKDCVEAIQSIGVYPDDMIKPELIKGNIKDLLKQVTKMFDKFDHVRSSLSYAIDGMVLSFADNEDQDNLGRSGRTNKWQMALKFDPSSATGIVRGISLSSGRKGFRTIQVELEEVAIIDGVRYDHIPVLSAELFDKMDLCEGDLVRIHRVGDVIPSITIEERNGGKKIHLPEKCPVCGAKLIREAKKLKCTHIGCKANLAGRILNFMDHAGIKGIGEAVAMDIVDVVNDTSIANIAAVLESDPEKFEKIGWSEDRVKKLQKELKDAISEMRDYEVLGSIGLTGVGIETAKNILEEVSFHDFVFTGYYPYGFVKPTDSISEEIFSIVKPTLQKLYPYIKHFTSKEDFENMKTVGHTGGDPSKETKKLIRDLGWDLVNGKKFDYLIVPSHGHSSTKTKVAKEKNIPMFTEAEFVKKFGK